MTDISVADQQRLAMLAQLGLDNPGLSNRDLERLYWASIGTYAPLGVVTTSRQRGMNVLPGQVCGSRSAYFERFFTDAGRCTRIKHVARVDMLAVSMTYGNYGNQDAEPNSAIKVRAGVEYPSGTFYAAHFAGEDTSRDVTIAPGGFVSTQPVAVRIPAGATYYTNTLVVPVTGGGQYPGGGIIIATGSGDDKCNPASATDYTMSANPGTASDQFAFGPVAVTAVTSSTTRSYAVVGDSQAAGTGDAKIDSRYENGFITRALNSAELPYVMCAMNGEAASNWDEASATVIGRHRYRILVAAGCTDVIQNHVTNDFGNNNKTYAQVQASLISSWTQLANRGLRVRQTTCTPRTTSTDSWATTANQTAVNTRFGPESGPGSDRQVFNAWLRDGAPILNGAAVATGSSATGTVRAGESGHPLYRVVDTAAVVEVLDATTSTWVWPAAYTTDGIHPNSTAHAAMAAVLLADLTA